MTAVLVVAWVSGAVALALVVARGVRIADERGGALPPRLDPRAGQCAERVEQRAKKAAPGVFTAVLAVAVLFTTGVAQQAFGGGA